MPSNDFVSECAIFITVLVVCILANIIGLLSIGESKFTSNDILKPINSVILAKSNAVISQSSTERSAVYEATNENDETPEKESRRHKLSRMIQNYRNKTKAKAKRMKERAKRLKPRLKKRRRNDDRRGDRDRQREDHDRNFYREESNDSVGYEEPSDIWMAENYLQQWREAPEDSETRKTLAMNWRRSQLTKSLANRRPF